MFSNYHTINVSKATIAERRDQMRKLVSAAFDKAPRD